MSRFILTFNIYDKQEKKDLIDVSLGHDALHMIFFTVKESIENFIMRDVKNRNEVCS